MSYIYGIFDKENCLYIGQTKRDNPEKTRWEEHKREIKNGRHKIKKLNTYKDNIDNLRFEVLCEVETSNSLVLSTLENFYNSLYHPFNSCVISGFRSNVTLKREDNKELCKEIIEVIKKHYS